MKKILVEDEFKVLSSLNADNINIFAYLDFK